MSILNHLRQDSSLRAITATVIAISIVLVVTLGLAIAVMVKVNRGRCACKGMKSNGTCTSHTPAVVFAAKSTAVYDIVNRRVIKFTTVMTNTGDGYSPTTGFFTAPYPGTYLFQTSVCARQRKWVYVNLVANNVPLVTTGVYDVDAHGSCTSATGITVLSKGEKAWVEGAWDDSEAMYVNKTYTIPTFTGVLLNLETR